MLSNMSPLLFHATVFFLLSVIAVLANFVFLRKLSKSRNEELGGLKDVILRVFNNVEEQQKQIKSLDQGLSVLLTRDKITNANFDFKKAIDKKLAELFLLTNDEKIKQYLTVKCEFMLEAFFSIKNLGIKHANTKLLREQFSAKRIRLAEIARVLDVQFIEQTTPARKSELETYLIEIEHIINYKGSNDVNSKFDSISYNYIVDQLTETFRDYNSYVKTGRIIDRKKTDIYKQKIKSASKLDDLIAELLLDYYFDDYRNELYLLHANIIDYDTSNARGLKVDYSILVKVRNRLLQIIDDVDEINLRQNNQ